MDLTEEIVNKIFMNCYIMKDNENDDFNDKTKFYIVKLKYPLHNGHRFIVFRND